MRYSFSIAEYLHRNTDQGATELARFQSTRTCDRYQRFNSLNGPVFQPRWWLSGLNCGRVQKVREISLSDLDKELEVASAECRLGVFRAPSMVCLSSDRTIVFNKYPSAPAAKAAPLRSLSCSCVRKTIFEPGDIRLILGAASIPFSRGKPISRSTMSGHSRPAFSIASTPSPASATTRQPAIGFTIDLNIARHGLKSSTSIIRITDTICPLTTQILFPSSCTKPLMNLNTKRPVRTTGKKYS